MDSDTIAREAVELLRELEWSAIARGQGSGPMGSGGDGRPFAACPVCRQLREPSIEFVREAVGHRSDCKLARVLDAVGRL